MGKGRDTRPGRVVPIGGNQIKTPYPTMTMAEIEAMPIADLADDAAHLWLWTTNKTLEDGFSVMRAWGFKYLAPIHWVKPSGIGAWFIHVSQTCLFGYKGKCVFPMGRYKRNVMQMGTPKRHSEKPDCTYDYIEAISPGPRLELFARRQRLGWTVWGNEVPVRHKCGDCGRDLDQYGDCRHGQPDPFPEIMANGKVHARPTTEE